MTLKIGHRGTSGYMPENTLASFRMALQFGVDGVEFDIQLSKDGVPVVMHDDTLERTTNGKGAVSDYTLAQLQALDAGGGEKIPALSEVIEDLAPHAMLFIEIKNPLAAQPVAKMLAHYAPQFGYAKLPVISFDWETLIEVQSANAQIVIGATPDENGMPPGFMEAAKQAGMWSVNPCIDTLEEHTVRDAHALGLKVIIWTANTPEQIARAKALGVDGIVGDFPDRL